jgi:hypothetical protein
VKLVQNKDSTQLEINSVYSGGSGLNEEFIIDSIKLYAEGKIYAQRLEESLIFKGTDKKTITIRTNSIKQNLLVAEE